ncbi:putative NSF attachment protein [Helianthus annuus]|uniref:NSF attachment protein n=1 Tax=Helianthus annuus TaxID=4232 RepID=A0A9K3P0C9_HELAN|nr:putative NSF attachment protein [Helianthus annuus]
MLGLCFNLCILNQTQWFIVPDRTEMNLPLSVPNSSYLANREPEPRTRTGANRELGYYGLYIIYIKYQLSYEIAELYEQEQNLEQAIAFYDKAADLFQGEEVTTSANQCKQKIAQFSAQLEQQVIPFICMDPLIFLIELLR